MRTLLVLAGALVTIMLVTGCPMDVYETDLHVKNTSSTDYAFCIQFGDSLLATSCSGDVYPLPSHETVGVMVSKDGFDKADSNYRFYLYFFLEKYKSLKVDTFRNHIISIRSITIKELDSLDWTIEYP